MNKAMESLEQAVDKLKWDMAKLENDLVEMQHIQKAVKAENDRYREALETIQNDVAWNNPAWKIADDALADTNGD